ncbi:hypothetical protein [Botrimarina sp.]|uniref:hypothetical protein n=1 Tax=Botrimarina sp. TaxID=2795802 RepID=UPI0032EFAF14
MAIDYSVRRATQHCAATGRELQPGEAIVSVLHDEAGEVVRRDYSAAAWDGPREGAIAWWRSRLPDDGKSGPAPREALLRLLDEWADRPDQVAARYVLALLLMRRRVLRPQADGFLTGLRGDPSGDEPAPALRLVCRERDEPFDVVVATPTAREATEIEQRLAELLGAA